MNLLQIDNISKSFGEKILFQNLSLGIEKGDKVGLIARNGIGKSTLMQIIAGKQPADEGTVTFRNGITVGYLEQEPLMNDSASVIQQVFQWDNPVIKLILEYEKAVLHDNKDRVGELIHKLDAANAWNYEVKIKQILTKLKINDLDFEVGKMSGGQKKRLALAAVMILEPDLYLLDEPTNHLDLGMIEWLEEYLIKSGSSLLMVTHDRYFLESICSVIVELDQNQLYTYRGNYAYYLEKRSERIENQNAVVDKARNILRAELEWVRRMPKARGTKAKYRLDSFHELKRKASQKITENTIDLTVKTERLGKKIIEIYNISKSFNNQALITDFTYLFKPSEKVGIVGDNASGKTTLANMIAGIIKPDTGHIEKGETVKIGYYSQAGIAVREDKKVIDVIKEISEEIYLTGGKRLSASQYLYHFQFPEKMHHAFVNRLSGGEKRRLYLMTVLMQNPNFLILDEPTNDLDIITLNILEDFLQCFRGCVLVVSHDRYFMNKIVDHIFIMDGKGNIKDYPGSYTEYKIAADRKTEVRNHELKEKVTRTKPGKQKKISFKEKREMDEIEAELAKLEAEKQSIENQLSSGIDEYTFLQNVSQRHQQVVEKIDWLTNRWIELSEFL